jgi:urease accessory protein
MIAGIFLFPEPLFAHLASGRFGDFYAGSLHLLTAIEHLIPMIALGLLAGMQGTKASRIMTVSLPLALIAGTVIGISTSGLSFSIYVNSFSFILVGGLIALNKSLSSRLILLMAVLLGTTHGYSNGIAVEPTLSALNYTLGVAISGLVIVTLFAGLAISVKKEWHKIAVRVAGSWIAAIGLISLPMLFN